RSGTSRAPCRARISSRFPRRRKSRSSKTSRKPSSPRRSDQATRLFTERLREAGVPRRASDVARRKAAEETEREVHRRARVLDERELDRVARHPARLVDRAEDVGGDGAARSDEDDLALGDARVVEEGADHLRVGIAEELVEDVAARAAREGLALAEGE